MFIPSIIQRLPAQLRAIMTCIIGLICIAFLSPSFSATATPADRAIHRAEALIARAPQQTEGYVALATASLHKARECGDSRYYQHAESAVQRVLDLQPASFEARRLRAWIQTGKHEFHAALETAQQLRQERPDDHWTYGLLGDAYVELGEYDHAAAVWQKMIDLHPSSAAYGRAARMRALTGDTHGATEIMAMAVRAASPRDPEALAWFLVQYGQLHFHQGRLDVAEAAYAKALAVFPQYYRALAALARVRGAQQRYPEAMTLYRQAVGIVPEPETVAALGDLLLLTGNADGAEQQYALVDFMARLNKLNQVTYGRQIAQFYADHNRKLDEALVLAERELGIRQDIYTYDTLAWVYYKTGRLTKAWDAMQHALRLGTQDASLWYHAGMIAHGRGDTSTAQSYLRRALDTNPYFSPFGAKLARLTLEEMQQATH